MIDLTSRVQFSNDNDLLCSTLPCVLELKENIERRAIRLLLVKFYGNKWLSHPKP